MLLFLCFRFFFCRDRNDHQQQRGSNQSKLSQQHQTRNLTSVPPGPLSSQSGSCSHLLAIIAVCLCCTRKQVQTSAISDDARIKHASVETTSPPPSSEAGDPSTDLNESPQQVLRLRWGADGNQSEGEDGCTVSIARLRQHCSSEIARTLRRQLGTSNDADKPDPTPVLWGKGVLSTSAAGSSPLRFEYKAIMDSSQTAASQLRHALKSHGVALVRGVPTELAATEKIGLKVAGHLMGTLFGPTVWDITNVPRDFDNSFMDSAISTDGLPLHTDYPYGAEAPGMQVK